MKTFNNAFLGEIVTDDFRAAGIFKEAGIDFCCGGKKTLETACREKNTDVQEIIGKLNDLVNEPSKPGRNFKDWDTSFLIDYIINTHHKYVLKTLPELIFYSGKIASVHGTNHLELIEVAALVEKINGELLQHLQREEEILFPAIRKVLKTCDKQIMDFLKAEILRMNDEHESAGGAMDKINVISHNYKVPEDGCSTYHLTFTLLEQFEDDLHVHVHLENNILFPRALAL